MQPTTILQTTDLPLKILNSANEESDEKKPIQCENVKCTVSLIKHYYIPGEPLILNLSIVNHASFALDKIIVEFVSIEEYDVTGRGKDCKTVIKGTTHMVIKIG